MHMALLAGSLCYTLFDDGISNLLGLETLRHGTNCFNYVPLRIRGGDPSHGGKPTGSTKGWDDDTPVNHFYVFKDSEYQLTNVSNYCSTMLLNRIMRIAAIGSRVLSRKHVFLSGYNFSAYVLGSEHSHTVSKHLKVAMCTLFGMINLIVCPTLRFRFSTVDPSRLMNDPCYRGAAYRTAQKIEWWRIGLIGSLITGINVEWLSRVKAKPLKILTGVVQIASAIALTTLCISTLAGHPFLAFTGALFA